MKRIVVVVAALVIGVGCSKDVASELDAARAQARAGEFEGALATLDGLGKRLGGAEAPIEYLILRAEVQVDMLSATLPEARARVMREGALADAKAAMDRLLSSDRSLQRGYAIVTYAAALQANGRSREAVDYFTVLSGRHRWDGEQIRGSVWGFARAAIESGKAAEHEPAIRTLLLETVDPGIAGALMMVDTVIDEGHGKDLIAHSRNVVGPNAFAEYGYCEGLRYRGDQEASACFTAFEASNRIEDIRKALAPKFVSLSERLESR